MFVKYSLDSSVDPLSTIIKFIFLLKSPNFLISRGLIFCGFIYVATNLNTTIEYGYKGMGKDITNGYIVNNFEMSGNRNYFEIDESFLKGFNLLSI